MEQLPRIAADTCAGLTLDRPCSVTAGVLRFRPAARSSRPAEVRGGMWRMVLGPGGWLQGREAGRFKVGPAVVPGQDLAEVAGPVRDDAVADLAAGDWRWVMVTRKWQELECPSPV